MYERDQLIGEALLGVGGLFALAAGVLAYQRADVAPAPLARVTVSPSPSPVPTVVTSPVPSPYPSLLVRTVFVRSTATRLVVVTVHPTPSPTRSPSRAPSGVPSFTSLSLPPMAGRSPSPNVESPP